MLALSPATAMLRLPSVPLRRRRSCASPARGGDAAAPAAASSAATGRRSAVVALLALVVALDALAGGRPLATHPALPVEPEALPLATLLGRHGPTPARSDSASTTPARLEAYLVTSARDCSANLGMLDLLAREAIAPRIHLAAALVVTSRQHADAHATLADSSAIRTVRDAIAARGLPTAGLPPPDVRALDPPTALLLRRVGYRSTPFLVVLDSAGALRFATPPSLSFADYRRLAHTLAAIAGDDAR